MDRAGVEGLGEGRGKVVGMRVHEEVGSELDLDADGIEQVGIVAARAVSRGTIADLLEHKATPLGPDPACPACRRACAVDRRPRALDFWGDEVIYAESVSHCRAWRRFFPNGRRGA